MNLKDILHGIIERTPFANETERADFHSAIDNLDSATGEESAETATATDAGNGTDASSGSGNAPVSPSPQAEAPAPEITAPPVDPAAVSSEVNPTEPESPSESSGESGVGSSEVSSGPGSPQGA